jgi:hypothetical protein
MELTDLTCFFGWMTAINLVVFVIGLLKLTVFKSTASRIGRAIMGDESESYMAIAPRVLMNYWVLIVVFNVAPYLALLCL